MMGVRNTTDDHLRSQGQFLETAMVNCGRHGKYSHRPGSNKR